MESEADRPTIKASCSECREEREYQPSAFHVTSLETTRYQIGWQYEFFCSACHDLSVHRVDAEVFAVLVNAGVTATTVLGPDEVADIVGRSEHAVLTVEDIAGWLIELDGDALMAELSAANEG